MKGAIFYSGQYGSTAQYADWIAEATGLPVFSIDDSYADPERYDFLILGSSVIVFKLTIRKWMAKHVGAIGSKPLLLFTVSGAPAGKKLSGWVDASLPAALMTRIRHVALRGRLNHAELPWWMRWFLWAGAQRNPDPQAREEELKGFDYMDKTTIEPIVTQILEWKSESAPLSTAA